MDSVKRLETEEVHSHGGIVAGTADCISGGVFVVSGASVWLVRSRGSATTYGPNDMVLDKWDGVDVWQSDARIKLHGPSAISFVNFGDLRRLTVAAAVETSDMGARGLNVYDGTLGEAKFERVVTHLHGAVGIRPPRSDRDVGRTGDTEVRFDGDSGRLRSWSIPTGRAVGTTLQTWLGDLHVADVIGVAMKFALALTGLMVAMLSVTGMLIWARKRPSRRRFKVSMLAPNVRRTRPKSGRWGPLSALRHLPLIHAASASLPSDPR